MNRNVARRCLTGIDEFYQTQTWTGTPYWLVRTRLWRRANLTLPDRIEGASFAKTRCQAVVDRHADAATPGRWLHGDWIILDAVLEAMPVEVVAPLGRRWMGIGFNRSWFLGVHEIVTATAADDSDWSMWVDLNGVAVVWRHGDQPVAVLKGILGEPRAKGDAA